MKMPAVKPVRQAGAVSFAVALRALAIFTGTVARLVHASFGGHKYKSVRIEILHREFKLLAGASAEAVASRLRPVRRRA